MPLLKEHGQSIQVEFNSDPDAINELHSFSDILGGYLFAAHNYLMQEKLLRDKFGTINTFKISMRAGKSLGSDLEKALHSVMSRRFTTKWDKRDYTELCILARNFEKKTPIRFQSTDNFKYEAIT